MASNVAGNAAGLFIAELKGGTVNVNQNTFVGNTSSATPGYLVGWEVANSNAGSGTGGSTFNRNNLLENGAQYLAYIERPNTELGLNMQDNWWGTTNGTEIQARIYDWFEDPALGIVDYAPFLTEPDPDAPAPPP